MPENTDALTSVLNLIKRANTAIEEAKKTLAVNKEMVDDALGTDPAYRTENEKVKQATKARTAVKQQILRRPELTAANAKVKDARTQLKDLRETLSEYLQEYQRITGEKTIEDENGEVKEIIYTARLVRPADTNFK